MSKIRRPKKRKLLRLLGVALAVLVVLGVVGAAGYYAFAGWRANDLAVKARQNFEEGNFRISWLQLQSARKLRAQAPEVMRVGALFDAAQGRPEALAYFENLAARGPLGPADRKARAEAAVRFGTDEQFAAAIAEMVEAGDTVEAARWQTARSLRGGDLDRAIIEMRRAVAMTEDPELQMTLARLLLRRYGAALQNPGSAAGEDLLARNEMIELVEALRETPQSAAALAFGLGELPVGPEHRIGWAQEAMGNVDADNPALLPAAVVLVRHGLATPGEIWEQLHPVYDTAMVERRAAFALWLAGAGRPQEALSLVTAQEAGQSTAAFGARTEALFQLENHDAVLAASETATAVDEDVRLLARARAEYAMGRGVQSGARSVGEALAAAARARRLELMLPSVDALGAARVADDKLVEMCGDPALADYVFRVTRDRLSRRGRSSLLATAQQRTLQAVPGSPAAADADRYVRLLSGEEVSPDETAAAVAAEPGNTAFRITHALALLRAGRPDDALRNFDDVTVFAEFLPPGQLAVVAAVLAANGDEVRGRAAARLIETERLLPGEYLLIGELRAAE